jgi:hypothetical protein
MMELEKRSVGIYPVALLLANETPAARLAERMPGRGGRKMLNKSFVVSEVAITDKTPSH